MTRKEMELKRIADKEQCELSDYHYTLAYELAKEKTLKIRKIFGITLTGKEFFRITNAIADSMDERFKKTFTR